MQTYTQVNMLKYVNNTYVLMQEHEHIDYDADSVYDGVQLYAAAQLTDIQVELDDTAHTAELDNEVLLLGYDSLVNVYYMHTGNLNFNFYVKTSDVQRLQLAQVA